MKPLNRSAIFASLVAALLLAAVSPLLAEPVVPERDPVLAAERTPTFEKAMLGEHPRLLFDASDLPRMRQNLTGATGKQIAGQLTRYLRASDPPAKPAFLRDATDGQRQGYWRMPTLAVHYALTGDESTLDKGRRFLELLLRLDHWETGNETDSGMSAANIMVGAALLYDTMHDDLEPEFREAVRRRLIDHARRMYHRGHLNRNNATAYWQGDPQNNHRWHRNAGLALCVLAAYSGHESERWILKQAKDDLDYVVHWLPEDGASHEGPTYLIFGGSHLTIACHAADRLLGTTYLEHEFFENAGRYLIQSLTPDQKSMFLYGDASGGSLATGYANFLYKTAAAHQQQDVQAVMDRLWKTSPKKMDIAAWMAVIWRDPTLNARQVTPATRALFPDIGLALIRDGWADDAVGAMFKCGPFGGVRLNEFRNENNFKYINVAHDDPDANSFILWKSGRLVAETDRYSRQKRSANHNTILINGVGQLARGRPEGGVWSQPARGRTDMTEMAFLTAYQPGEAVSIVEGEAAGSYIAYRDRKSDKSRPALERYRRTFVWVEEKYILVIDDIRAPEPVEITWLMQAPKLTRSGEDQHYVLAADQVVIPFEVSSSAKLASDIATSPADHRGKPLGWQQLRLTSTTGAIRIASLYNAWDHPDLSLATDFNDDTATITVTGPSFTDTWRHTPSKNNRTPSTLIGRRGDTPIAELTPEDLAAP